MELKPILLTALICCFIGSVENCICSEKKIHLGCICAKPNQTLEIEQHPNVTEIKSGECFQILNYTEIKHHKWAHIIYKEHNAFVKMFPRLYDTEPCGNFTTTLPTTTALTTKGPFSCSSFHIVTPKEWGAGSSFFNQPEMKTNFSNLPQFVIIHHTSGKNCSTTSECEDILSKDLQHWTLHKYNFAVGEDGNVYEMYGFTHPGYQGKGAEFYNKMSIGVTFIGDFEKRTPNQSALDALHHLLQCGVERKLLDTYYLLRAIRDIDGSKSPGDALYSEITKWPHY